MALWSIVTRVADGLPLLESTDAVQIVGADTQISQAKAILKRLDASSPARLAIAAKAFTFSYMVENGLVALVLTDAKHPSRLAFAFLKAVHDEFEAWLRAERGEGWRAAIATEAKPYAFLGFGKVLSRLRREFGDADSKANASRLHGELYEVQNIMRKNIEEVLDRGEKLDREGARRARRRRPIRACARATRPFHSTARPPPAADVSKVSSRLVSESKQFKWGAQKLSMLERWKAVVPWLVAALVILFVLWWRFR